jgi:hypothetical protein
MSIDGLRVFESLYAVRSGEPVEVPRSWGERLFTRPWRPFRRTRIVVPQIPMAYKIGETLVAHPDFLAQLRNVSHD